MGGVVGGVVGGVSALFGGPGYTYTPANGYGGPFAAPFNAAGASRRSALPGGRRRFWRHAGRPLTKPLPATGAPAVQRRGAVLSRLRWAVHCDLLAGARVRFL